VEYSRIQFQIVIAARIWRSGRPSSFRQAPKGWGCSRDRARTTRLGWRYAQPHRRGYLGCTPSSLATREHAAAFSPKQRRLHRSMHDVMRYYRSCCSLADHLRWTAALWDDHIRDRHISWCGRSWLLRLPAVLALLARHDCNRDWHAGKKRESRSRIEIAQENWAIGNSNNGSGQASLQSATRAFPPRGTFLTVSLYSYLLTCCSSLSTSLTQPIFICQSTLFIIRCPPTHPTWQICGQRTLTFVEPTGRLRDLLHIREW